MSQKKGPKGPVGRPPVKRAMKNRLTEIKIGGQSMGTAWVPNR